MGRMNLTGRAWGLIIATIVVIALVVWWLSALQTSAGAPGAPTASTNEGVIGDSDSVDNPATSGEVTVTFDGTSFSPNTVTVPVGGTVRFRSTGAQMWVASGMHPTHDSYHGTTRAQHCPDTAGVAFDQCATGSTYAFTFQKAGTWKYHDHLNPSAYGEVVVR